MSSPSESRLTVAAAEVAAGSFVTADLDGRRTLCLKLDRVGKDHTNYFLVPVDPVADRRALALVYIDPDTPVVAVDGVSFAFTDALGDLPEVGDAFSAPSGVFIKVIDRPLSQRMHAYVEVATGQLRLRMERRIGGLLHWSIQRF